jgi:predicted dinucleotide-binding enzyme
MDIGIIGAGNIGATLARKLTAAGHTVRLANSRGPETIRKLAEEAGASAVTVDDALKNVDVVIPPKNFGGDVVHDVAHRLPKNRLRSNSIWGI